MLNIKNYQYQDLTLDSEVTKKYAIKLEALKEGQKISLMSDAMFKTMFVNSKRIKYGAKLLSYILEISYEELLDNLKLVNSELDKDKVYSKNERCDYVAKIDDTIINIEVNCNNSIAILERNMEYAHRLYASKIKNGSNYEFKQVIQINLNNFSFKGSTNTLDVFYVQTDDKIKLTNKLIFIQIYIPNLRKKCYNEPKSELSDLEKFILTLVETDIDSAHKIGDGDEFMKESIEDQVEFCLSDDMRESYDHELAIFDNGYFEGHEQGREQGYIDTLRKVIKQMKSLNVEDELIMKYLNISEDKLNSILEDI